MATFCPKCGKEIPKGRNFCLSCGAYVSNPAQSTPNHTQGYAQNPSIHKTQHGQGAVSHSQHAGSLQAPNEQPSQHISSGSSLAKTPSPVNPFASNTQNNDSGPHANQSEQTGPFTYKANDVAMASTLYPNDSAESWSDDTPINVDMNSPAMQTEISPKEEIQVAKTLPIVEKKESKSLLLPMLFSAPNASDHEIDSIIDIAIVKVEGSNEEAEYRAHQKAEMLIRQKMSQKCTKLGGNLVAALKLEQKRVVENQQVMWLISAHGIAIKRPK